MKINLLFTTLLFIKLVHGDWLAIGTCNEGQFVLGASIMNGDCAIMGQNTYRYSKCTEDSYKMWDCSGDDCEEWAKHNKPTDTGPLNVCENNQMQLCFKSFNETNFVNKMFPTAERVAILYTFPQWVPEPPCNATLQSVDILALDVCAKPFDDNNYLLAQCDEKNFSERGYSDASCEKPAEEPFRLPVEKCQFGWYVTCFDQNTSPVAKINKRRPY
jgi:hypothetical protein